VRLEEVSIGLNVVTGSECYTLASRVILLGGRIPGDRLWYNMVGMSVMQVISYKQNRAWEGFRGGWDERISGTRIPLNALHGSTWTPCPGFGPVRPRNAN